MMLASTSARATSTAAADAATLKTQENEETIRTLLQQIDEDSWKNEEYFNHLAEFDSHSEELSKLKSNLDECCEDNKAIFAALDQMLLENDQMKETCFGLQRDNDRLHRDFAEAMEEQDRTEARIKEADDRIKLLNEQLEKTEKLANGYQWEVVQRRNLIDDLEEKFRNSELEIVLLKDAIGNLQSQLKKKEVDHRKDMANYREVIGTICKQNIGQKLLRVLKTKSCSTECNGNDNSPSSQAVAPYCGLIQNWDFMIVPVLKGFFKS